MILVTYSEIKFNDVIKLKNHTRTEKVKKNSNSRIRNSWTVTQRL